MKKHYRFAQRKVYRTMFLSILMLTSVVIMVVSTVLFVLFSRSSVKEVGAMSKSMLYQTSYAADIVENQVHTVGNQLINDRTVTNAMFNPAVDRVEEYGVVNLLNRLQAVYTFIDYIGIYNEYTGRYINTKGLTAEDEGGWLADPEHLLSPGFTNLFPRTVKSAVGNQEMELLTFVMMPGSVSFFPKKGAIVVNMKQSYITNLLQGLRNKSSNFLIVTDDKGTILSRTDRSQFLQNASGEPYMKRLLASGTSSGSFVTKVDGEKNLVSYVKSEELGWYFVSVNRYDEILGNLIRLKRVVLAIAVLMVIGSVLIIYWLTNQMYDPLDKLIHTINGTHRTLPRGAPRVNEFSLLGEIFVSITEKANRLEPALSAAYKGQLLQYMKGGSADLPPRPLERLDGPRFRVTLIKLDEYAAFKAVHDDKTQSVIRFAVCNISEELTGMESVIVEEDEIALLEQLPEGGEAPDIAPALREIQSTLRSYFKLSVTVSIGGVAESASGIRDSYQAARKALRSRFVEGIGHVYTCVCDGPGDGGPADAAAWNAIESGIVQAIAGGGVQETDDAIGRAVGEVRKLSYDQALFQLNRLLNGLFHQFGKSPATREEAYAFIELAYSLISCETVDEAAARMREIGLSIGQLLESRTKSRHEDIVEEIKLQVGREYGNPNLSLDAFTDRFQLTSGYLGKMFKSATGISFSDYLKETRLEKARELLLETRWTAAEIGERVGVYNSTYFYTLFKKRYGSSPAQYRADALRARETDENRP